MRYYTQRWIHNTNCTFFFLSVISKASDDRQGAPVTFYYK